MTPEELLKLAQSFIDQGIPSALMTVQGAAGYQLAEGYIESRAENAALSVKLEEAEKKLRQYRSYFEGTEAAIENFVASREEVVTPPLCRCPDGVCLLHPSLKTCGMRERGEVVTPCPQWQPIETVPKDGTVVNVWLGDADDEDVQFYCLPGTRISCGWHWLQGRMRPALGLSLPVVTVRATHWMPLPEGPQS